MQDRFKLKFWDKTDKELGEVINIDFDNGVVDFKTKDGITSTQLKCGELIQCTGLRDKRHQLIYESDIVTDGYNNMLVYYNRETCSFAMQKRTKYTLKRFGKNGYEVVSLRNLSENHFKNYQLEIIGNEFQNPELLEVKNEHT